MSDEFERVHADLEAEHNAKGMESGLIAEPLAT